MSDQQIVLEGFKDAVGEILVDCTAITPMAATPSRLSKWPEMAFLSDAT